ncbi:MAG: hypothetical protein WCQ67_08855, partial [Treponema sp.]
MKNFPNKTLLSRMVVCVLVFALLTSSVFAKESKTTNKNSKIGIVTSMFLNSKENTVTITIALGTVKTPEKNSSTEAKKTDFRNPPKKPNIADMIELTGESVTFTVSANTEVARSMLLAPTSFQTADNGFVENDDDSTEKDFPPPPQNDFMPPPNEKFNSEITTAVSEITLNDVITVSFDANGTTVSSISEDSGEPPRSNPAERGPQPMMAP